MHTERETSVLKQILALLKQRDNFTNEEFCFIIGTIVKDGCLPAVTLAMTLEQSEVIIDAWMAGHNIPNRSEHPRLAKQLKDILEQEIGMSAEPTAV